MKRIAITGGIGSGKSYVCRLLAERGIDVFNCDAVAKGIIAHDPVVRTELTTLIGGEPPPSSVSTAGTKTPLSSVSTAGAKTPPSSVSTAGAKTPPSSVSTAGSVLSSSAAEPAPILTKERLGAYLRTSPDHAARVNAIVHPRVAAAFEQSGMEWMECAILFESGFDRLVDRVVVVTCPEDERIRRIIARDHCDAATARRWLALQMTDEERIARATYHIVNDGITPLEPQLDALLQSL